MAITINGIRIKPLSNDSTTEGNQQMQTGKDYWAQLANKPTWLDTFITPINGGQLSEVVVKPTNDESWLFSLGKYARNGRKPLADSHARKVVANYLSRFDNESAKDYNARISRLADTLDIRGVQFTKNNVESGKLKNRAHYDIKSNTAYIDDIQDIFAEIAHPWQDAIGNNSMNDEYKKGNYDPDIDPRGGTRYAYPDTFEGETHGFFQPALTEWVETGKIGRSLPLLNEDLSNEKIVPKDNIEVLDSAASWNKQAIDKRVIANPHQLPLTKRIQYSIWDYPLLDKRKAYGGNLYDGTSQTSQQMDNSYTYYKPLENIFVDREGNLRDPEVPRARGSILLPEVTAAYPDLKDMAGRYNIASNDAITVANGRPVNMHLRKAVEEGAIKQAAWAQEHPYLNMAGIAAGAAPLVVATTPAVVGGGELAATALANPYVDAGLTSYFGAHGLNHAINEGIADWKDGVVTALEVTPLGRLARPIWNVVKPTRNFVPTLESNMSGVRYAYNRNPELAKIGSLEDYNNYLKTVFPESKVKDINYHMGPKGLQELKPSTGKVYNTNPDARGIYVTPDKSYAQRLRKYTTDRLEKPSFFTYIKRNLVPGGWDKANDVFTDIYPVMVDTKNPLSTKGTWTWGIKDKKYQSLMDDYDAIVNSGPKWYQNFNSMPEIIVPKTEQSLILGSDTDVAGFRRFMSNPQITAENAAITPTEGNVMKVNGVPIEPKTIVKLYRIMEK